MATKSGYTLVDHTGRPIRSSQKRSHAPRATFDAATTAIENRDHWAAADSLSARSANSAEVRQKLRDRSRYEAQNNPYLRAIISSLANDTIGTGPRLQLSFREFTDPDFQVRQAPPTNLAHEVEIRWQEWCDEIGLTDKLILADKAETRDGEVFAVKRMNPNLRGVKLDMQLVEAEVCCTPDIDWSDPRAVDGMRLDEFGNVSEYHFLRRHPGDLGWFAGYAWDDYEVVPARNVCHIFDPDRVAEYRGLPATTATLNTYGDARGYRKSVLHAARTHASITAVIESKDGAYTDQTIPDEHGEDDDAFDKVPLNRDTYLQMPDGKTVKFLSPTQPIPSYREVSGEFNSECGRAINNAPRNIATGSSAEYNFASGKLDRQGWNRGIMIRRDRRRRGLLLPFFWSWVDEGMLTPGYFPAGLPPLSSWRVRYQWDGFESIDPVKDATAREIMLRSGQTTLDDVCAELGKDWEEVLEQQAREKAKRKSLGLDEPEPTAVPAGEDME